MQVQIIVCVNKNNCIGKNNDLLCFLPSDLKYFKKLTSDNVVIMGRKTFESLPKGALPNRINIVITHDTTFTAPNVIVMQSVEDALHWCNMNENNKNIFIIGGGSLYKYCLENNIVDIINMTYAHNELNGDVYFPIIDESKWEKEQIRREFFDERDECDYQILKYTKKINKN